MIRKRRRRYQGSDQELDTTPFMNLMAVLTPFLLATAVFTRLAVLPIYLPTPSDDPVELNQQKDAEEEELFLTISISDRGLIVANGNKILSFIPSTEKGQDFKSLSEILVDIKDLYPDEENVIILSMAEIAYGTVVAVMDITRTTLEGDAASRRPLFPNVSLGEIL